MKKVLVTSIGTVNAGAVIAELKKMGNLEVIGADINDARNVVNSREVDSFYKFPSVVANVDSYVSFLKGFCIQNRVTNIFPFIDEEVVALSEKKDDFEKHGINVCVPEYKVVSVCHYKDRFSEWLMCNLPEYAIPVYEKIAGVKYPAFVKPVEGRASVGCRRVNSRAELESVIGDEDWGRFIVQPFVEGNIISADLVRDRASGHVGMIQRRELLRNANGCGISVEIVDEKEVSKFCTLFAEKLDLDGAVNIEFFQTSGGLRVIEVNPRLPAGTSYDCMAGFNVVRYVYEIANHLPCSVPTDVGKWVGKRFARRYETVEM